MPVFEITQVKYFRAPYGTSSCVKIALLIVNAGQKPPVVAATPRLGAKIALIVVNAGQKAPGALGLAFFKIFG
jgi:hypothetical protein